MRKKKIVITTVGGHFLAALAVIEELKKERDWQIYWIGASSAFEEVDVPPIEAEILPQLDIPFFEIKTGKIQRGRFLQTLLSLSKLPTGFAQSLFLLRKTKPSIVLSFGGYISIPVAFAAWALRIPVVIHEQTTSSGFANRVVSRIARKVAISHVGSGKDFPADKTVLTGNPVRMAIWQIAKSRKPRPRQAKRGGQKAESKNVVIYITGGSRGSRVLNRTVFGILPQLLELGRVYHQTGSLDITEALEKRKRLAEKKDDYDPEAIYTPQEVERIYKEASVVISRAGANTVSELEVLGIPAVLVPIPWSENNEQYKNARLLEKKRKAIIILQNELTGERLLAEIKKILSEPKYFKKRKGLALSRRDATQRLIKLINSISR